MNSRYSEAVQKPKTRSDTRPVVPGAIEKDHFTRSWQVLDIALEVPLAPFGFVRFCQCYHSSTARIEVLGEATDRATLTGCISSFEQHNDFFAGCLHPTLSLYQLGLEFEKLWSIVDSRTSSICRDRGFRCRSPAFPSRDTTGRTPLDDSRSAFAALSSLSDIHAPWKLRKTGAEIARPSRVNIDNSL